MEVVTYTNTNIDTVTDTDTNAKFVKQLAMINDMCGVHVKEYCEKHSDIFCDIFFNKNVRIDNSIGEDSNFCARINILGIYYYWIVNDFDKAFDCWSFECLKEDEHTMDHLGIYYLKVKKDYMSAKKYFEKAIDHGYSGSMYNLGMYYLCIEQNYTLSLKYHMQAMEKGYVESMFVLGLYYYDIEKNYDEMKRYWLMALDCGHIGAIFHLGSYYVFDERNIEIGERYLLMANEKGYIGAMTLLGLYYADIGNYEDAYKNMVEGLKRGDYTQLNSLVKVVSKCSEGYEKLYLICEILLEGNDAIKHLKELEECGVEKSCIMNILDEQGRMYML